MVGTTGPVVRERRQGIAAIEPFASILHVTRNPRTREDAHPYRRCRAQNPSKIKGQQSPLINSIHDSHAPRAREAH